HTYQNDSLSNRLLKDHEEYQVNALNQLVRKGEETYQYDRNGNLIEKKRGNEKTLYAYDALNRLVQATKKDEEIKYGYDGFNRRLKVVKGKADEKAFIFAGQEEIGAIVKGEIVELKVISKGERTPAIALELKNALYVPLYDIFGQIVCLNNSQGEVIERYRYTAYGETEIVNAAGTKLKESSIGNPWMYANRRLDLDTGLVAFGLRYYDPEAGRWITTDPAGFEDGPNLYAYVHNNPLIYLDQYGLFALNSGRQNWLLDSPLGAPAAMMDYSIRDVTTASVFHRNYDGSIPTHIPTANNFDNNLQNRDFGTPGVYRTNEDFGFNYRDHPGVNAIYIPGFNTDFPTFVENLQHLSETCQWNIKGIYYGKHSMAKNLKHQYNALFRCIAYPPTRMLLSTWYKGFEEGPIDAISVVFGHSHGQVHLQNGIIAFPPQMRNRVHAIGIAPACSIRPGLCASVRNFWSLRDFVPLADFPNALKHRNTIVLLKPWRGADLHDHGVQSQTFSPSIRSRFGRIVNPFFREEL
ncbi:MAG: RHS repeat domain-containing protein, partial [Chlamydiales bacterium]